jgi:predicted nucleic acid-binding protein
MGKKKIVLVDTDIFIKVFRGDARYKKHLDLLSGNIAVSIITVLELYQGANTKSRKFDLEKQLKAYNIIHIDEKISATAWLLTKKYLPGKSLLPPDCLIAATALNFSYELFTDNKKDFDFIKGIKFYQY